MSDFMSIWNRKERLSQDIVAQVPSASWYPGMYDLKPFWDLENPTIVDEVRERIDELLPLAVNQLSYQPLGTGEFCVTEKTAAAYQRVLRALVKLCFKPIELALIWAVLPESHVGNVNNSDVLARFCNEIKPWYLAIPVRSPCLRLFLLYLRNAGAWIVSREVALFVSTRLCVIENNKQPLMRFSPLDVRGVGYESAVAAQTEEYGKLLASVQEAATKGSDPDLPSRAKRLVSGGDVHFAEFVCLFEHPEDFPDLLSSEYSRAEAIAVVEVLCDGIVEASGNLLVDQYGVPNQPLHPGRVFTDLASKVQGADAEWLWEKLAKDYWAAPVCLPPNHPIDPWGLVFDEDCRNFELADVRDSTTLGLVQGFHNLGWPELASALTAHHLLQYILNSEPLQDRGAWFAIFKLVADRGFDPLLSNVVRFALEFGTLTDRDQRFLTQFIDERISNDKEHANVFVHPSLEPLRRPVAEQNLRALLCNADGEINSDEQKEPLTRKAWAALVDTEVRFYKAHAYFSSGEQQDFGGLIVGLAKAIEIHLQATLGRCLKPNVAEVIGWLDKCGQTVGTNRLSLANLVYIMKTAPRSNAFPTSVRGSIEQATSDVEALKRLGIACEKANLTTARNLQAHTGSASLSEAQRFREVLGREGGVLRLLAQALPVTP